MKVNYQLVLDDMLRDIEARGETPRLLLHSCCGPCSSYVLEYLARYFRITLFYYNPNMDTAEEYARRTDAVKLLLASADYPHPVSLQVAPYDHGPFLRAAAGLENEPEGGARCTRCFELRLGEAARLAALGGFDYYAATLTVSPHKDALRINRIGREMGERYGVAWLPSDFKKKEGFKRSTVLSKQYGLYRQDYCGCEFSKSHLPVPAPSENE
jgi:predicted adenine nucleotide alpha hydrolase (AANH) superfamily ATPase